MKIVQESFVHIMFEDSKRESLGQINGKDYNGTWPLTIVEKVGKFYWFTGGWSNRMNKTGPFTSVEFAEQDAYKVLGAID